MACGGFLNVLMHFDFEARSLIHTASCPAVERSISGQLAVWITLYHPHNDNNKHNDLMI